MTQNINNMMRQSFLSYPGVYSNLNVQSSISEQPSGMHHILPRYISAAVYAMEQLERHRGLILTIDDTPFVIPGLDLSVGSNIEIMTNYGFYCDPHPEYAIVAVICGGTPPDVPRIISSHNAMPIKVITPHKFSMVNLIIVPPSRFDDWLVILKSTYLNCIVIRNEKDLTSETVGSENIIGKEVILLSSPFYKTFNKMVSGIMWARLIIDESEENPKIVNSQYMVENGDFNWFLTRNPSEWIENPKVKSRFVSMGIMRTPKIWPEFFYIRTSPEYLEEIFSSQFVKAIPMEFSEIELKLGRLTLVHHHMQDYLLNSRRRNIDAYHYQYRMVEQNIFDTYNKHLNTQNLEITRKMFSIIKTKSCIDEIQEQIMRDNISMVRSIGMDYLSMCSQMFQNGIETYQRDIDIRIKEINEKSFREADEKYGSYLKDRDNIIQSFILSSTTKVPRDVARREPMYVIARCEEPPVKQILKNASFHLHPGYIMAVGKVNFKNYILDKFESSYVIVGLAHGLHVLSELPVEFVRDERNRRIRVVLISNHVKMSDPNTLIMNNIPIPMLDQNFDMGSILFDSRSSFKLVYTAYCMIILPDHDPKTSEIPIYKLAPGTELILRMDALQRQ
jgi:hypothetical protein